MLKPLNRYILIDVPKAKDNTTSSGIFLPDDYQPTADPHIVVKVIDYADDVRFASYLDGEASHAEPNDIYVMVDKSMIEQIVYKGTNYSLILDNYVKGVFDE